MPKKLKKYQEMNEVTAGRFIDWIKGFFSDKKKRKVLKNGSIVESDPLVKYDENKGLSFQDKNIIRTALVDKNLKDPISYLEQHLGKSKAAETLIKKMRDIKSNMDTKGVKRSANAALTKALEEDEDPNVKLLGTTHRYVDTDIDSVITDYDSGVDADKENEGEEEQSKYNYSIPEDFKKQQDSYKPINSYKDKELKFIRLKDDHVNKEKEASLLKEQSRLDTQHLEDINEALKEKGLKGKFIIAKDNNGYSATYKYIGGSRNDYKSVQKILDNLKDDKKFSHNIAEDPFGNNTVSVAPFLYKASNNENEFILNVPNIYNKNLSFNEAMKNLTERSIKNPYSTSLFLGKRTDGDGKDEYLDLGGTAGSEGAGILIAAGTGSGKTVLVNSMLGSLASTYNPDEVEVFIFDGKGNQYNDWKNSKHMTAPVLDTADMNPEEKAEKAIGLLKHLEQKMEERKRKIGKYIDIETYNKHNPNDMIPPTLFIFDEYEAILANLKDSSNKKDKEKAEEIERILKYLGMQARAYGMKSALVTQHLNVNTLPTSLRTSYPVHIFGRLAQQEVKSNQLDSSISELPAGTFLLEKGGNRIGNIRVPFIDVKVPDEGGISDIQEIIDKANQRVGKYESPSKQVRDQIAKLNISPDTKDYKKEREKAILNIKDKVLNSYKDEPIEKNKDLDRKDSDKDTNKKSKEKSPTEKQKGKKLTKDQIEDNKDNLALFTQAVKDILEDFDPTDKSAVDELKTTLNDIDRAQKEDGLNINNYLRSVKSLFMKASKKKSMILQREALKKLVNFGKKEEEKENKIKKLVKDTRKAGEQRKKKEEKDKKNLKDEISSEDKNKMQYDKIGLLKQIKVFEKTYKNDKGDKPAHFERIKDIDGAKKSIKNLENMIKNKDKQIKKTDDGQEKTELTKKKKDVEQRKKKKESQVGISEKINEYEEEWKGKTGLDVKWSRRGIKVEDDLD